MKAEEATIITMTEMIAYCGLDCTKCDAFIATQTRNLALKKTVAERWTKELKTKIGPADVECRGCKSETLSVWCLRFCKIRPCAEARGAETCAHCKDYPCAELEKFLSAEHAAKENLDRIRKIL